MTTVAKLNRAPSLIPPRVDWQRWIPDQNYNVYVVTSTADNASGSPTVGTLRWALQQPGPRLIVFNTSGQISLLQELVIPPTGVTGATIIAGQTAPSPGITFRQWRVKVQSNQGVVLMHLCSRVGDQASPVPTGNNRDNFSVGSSSNRASNVAIINCSGAYSIDENMSTSDQARNVLIYNGLFCYALFRATYVDSGGVTRFVHPDVTSGESEHHSMGSLNTARDVYYVNNVFAHCFERNLRVKAGSRLYIISNYFYSWGASSASYAKAGSAACGLSWQDSATPKQPTRLLVLGNIWRLGPSSTALTKCMWGSSASAVLNPASRAYLRGNRLYASNGTTLLGTDSALIQNLANEPAGTILTSTTDVPWTAPDCDLTAVGSRPWDRNAIDSYALASITNGTGRAIDSPNEIPPGYPSYAVNSWPTTIAPPANPIGKTAMLAWLAQYEVAGLTSPP